MNERPGTPAGQRPLTDEEFTAHVGAALHFCRQPDQAGVPVQVRYRRWLRQLHPPLRPADRAMVWKEVRAQWAPLSE